MVNYRRVVCEVAMLGVLLAVSTAAPTPECSHSIHYDQRQNGSENYRVSIDGVVVAVAPAESLLSALGDMDDIMDLLSVEDFNTDFKPPQSSSSPSPPIQIVPVSIEGASPKPENKPEVKPLSEKLPEEKPEEVKPEVAMPQEEKPEVPAKPADASSLSDVSIDDDMKIQKKEASLKKQEKAKRLKSRIAAFLMPLLRKTRHH